MPTVPRYSQPQVREEALPGPRVSTDAPASAFGAGQASQKLFGEIQGVMEKAKHDADQLSILDADRQLAQAETELLYAPQTGAINKKGKDAFGVHDEVMQSLESRTKEIEEGLKNETQRAAFRQRLAVRQSDIDRQLQKHVSSEIQSYDSQTTESYLANERDAAIANYHDPQRVQDSISRQQYEIMTHADRNGLPDEWVKQKTVEATSSTHAGIVSRMLANGQDREAKGYFEANRDNFSGKHSAEIEKDLEEGSLRGESQRQSDDIFNKYSGSLSQAMEKAREIDEPKLRDEVVGRIKDRFALKEAEKRQWLEGLHKGATDIIDRTGNVDEIPREQWRQFSLSERSALKNYARTKAEGLPVETDWQEYTAMKLMAANPSTRKEFMQTNINALRPRLGDSEYKELVSIKADLLKGKTPEELDDFRSKDQIVNGVLLSAGIDASPKEGSDDAKKSLDFKNAVAAEVRTLQKQTGKKATNEDVQRITDNLMIEGVTERRWWWSDKKKRLFELSPDDKSFEIEAKDVPQVERTKIEEALRRRGIAASDDKVLELYAKKLGGMAKRAPRE